VYYGRHLSSFQRNVLHDAALSSGMWRNLYLGTILSVFKGSLLSSLHTGTYRLEATGTSKAAEKLYQCVCRHFS